MSARLLAALALLAASAGHLAAQSPATPAPATPPAASASHGAGSHAHQHEQQHQHAAAEAPIVVPAGALHTVADVRFMQHMIGHHAQAVYMSRLAAARGAGARLVRFAQKIDQSQAGEIAQMQDWLQTHGHAVPDTASWRQMGDMPGMVSPADLARLDAARGAAFERLFLTLMIRHHEGALRMVADLLAAPRAAQDVDVSVLANDVETTQTAEIALMRRMLRELPPDAPVRAARPTADRPRR